MEAQQEHGSNSGQVCDDAESSHSDSEADYDPAKEVSI